MWFHKNQKMPRRSYLNFIKDGTLNESMSIDQLHVANNIYYIGHEEWTKYKDYIQSENDVTQRWYEILVALP